MMTINFILNGEDVSVETDPGKRLVDILRKDFKLSGTKRSCNTGICGSCLVIFNEEIMQSCLIPAFRVQDSEIVTIEGFSQTDEYKDYIQGFMEAKIEHCGFCVSGKILASESLLNRNPRPTREEILSAFQGIKCRCTSQEELVKSLVAVTEQRRRRLHGFPKGWNFSKGGFLIES